VPLWSDWQVWTSRYAHRPSDPNSFDIPHTADFRGGLLPFDWLRTAPACWDAASLTFRGRNTVASRSLKPPSPFPKRALSCRLRHDFGAPWGELLDCDGYFHLGCHAALTPVTVTVWVPEGVPLSDFPPPQPTLGVMNYDRAGSDYFSGTGAGTFLTLYPAGTWNRAESGSLRWMCASE
jgi:hypothetical protein